jgi:hypothetical protein
MGIVSKGTHIANTENLVPWIFGLLSLLGSEKKAQPAGWA